ncbi:MAG TPA: LuxR C-terminal-related transcriptional regulator [Steroidobacteraceae bacterium]|jgi:DNA-binding CsgD family transcriptional regulator|nr:LuxR C-terminal-related transcriptional regulator [Steroidobacteraceae bacterium]
MNLQDCQEVACARDLRTFEGHLVRFAQALDFNFMTGALVLETPDAPATILPFGNFPEDYKSICSSIGWDKRDPVLRRLKKLRVPFVYDQSLYVDESAADIWEVQAEFGFKTGIAMRLYLGPGKHLIIGVDRDSPLSTDSACLSRTTADVHLYASHAQIAVLRLLGPPEDCSGDSPKLGARELEILKWTSEGKSAWVVGQILNTSEHTVNYHLRVVMAKLAVGSKHQAAAKARALGLL